jgi:5-methylcytosine-specific restriction endonuclease McrA
MHRRRAGRCGHGFIHVGSSRIWRAKFHRSCIAKNKGLEKKDFFKNSSYLIFMRDEFKCVFCGKSPIDDNVKLQVDHIYPHSKGGGNDVYNLVSICNVCNSCKGSSILNDEMIYRLWKRNLEIDKKNHLVKKYSELKEYFDTVYNERTR